jgi:acetyl/propionyl-CoA carboxylase alpha subunit
MVYRFQVAGKIYQISIDRQGEDFKASYAGKTLEIEILDEQPGMLSIRLDGQPAILHWANDGGKKWVSLDGCTYVIEKPSVRTGQAGRDQQGAGLQRSPMPAQVRSIEVVEGDPVERGQTLLLLEAMKMEIRIKAPHPGRVARILVRPGQTIDKDQALVELL